MNRFATTFYFALLAIPLMASADSMVSTAPENADVYFIQPPDGATVDSTFKVVFGLQNMGVAPAGVERDGTGHHHLLINTDAPSDMSKPLPATDQIRHFGGGQTETEVTLPPGKHTLQLLLGNYAHVPHSKPVVSEKITVMVK
ncbi:DUF4399 domain-containing protein [Marinobacter halotolerans]|uniref:DUF4399 domain-containing protein n=1 Tax=Marinobacter halotolerans TaxID=1569211 RepID=UPI0012483DAA